MVVKFSGVSDSPAERIFRIRVGQKILYRLGKFLTCTEFIVRRYLANSLSDWVYSIWQQFLLRSDGINRLSPGHVRRNLIWQCEMAHLRANGCHLPT